MQRLYYGLLPTSQWPTRPHDKNCPSLHSLQWNNDGSRYARRVGRRRRNAVTPSRRTAYVFVRMWDAVASGYVSICVLLVITLLCHCRNVWRSGFVYMATYSTSQCRFLDQFHIAWTKYGYIFSFHGHFLCINSLYLKCFLIYALADKAQS